ncbi:MAG: 50S ribosomal protein L9 [Gemmatimonadetes bacterium RBG_16_66_8]|nr:MAG: 50S ribosomal protein L9 [Gemmatimonadetes bacterium RBG_16_66_8]
MDVILRDDIEHLGRAGEIVRVKDGYARNFLIPRGLAYQATEGNRRRIDTEHRRRAERHAADQATAQDLAQRLADVSLTFTMKAGEGDRLFGSITSADIAGKLHELGHDIDKRRIELADPIKLVGIYKVPVRLDAGVHAELRVWVVREE